MEPNEGLEPEPGPATQASRVWRGLAVIAVSLVVIAATGIAYLHPTFGTSSKAAAPPLPHALAQTSYQPVAVDFVGPNTGWVAALFSSGAYALLATSDGGQSWVKQLSGATGGSIYLRFFDAKQGVFAVIGQQSEIYRTADGGRTWSAPGPFPLPPNVLSLSFADPSHGWLLLSSAPSGSGSAELLSTDDGGVSWTNLGLPVLTGDEAFRVEFADPQTGWIDSFNAGPYAYRSDDAGATWQQIPMPAPAGGWPKTGQFFVAAHPTKGLGVVTTVINFQPPSGRSGIGGSVVAYPPLTVGTFDGGAPVRYVYATLIDNASGAAAAPIQTWFSSASQIQAPGQVYLGSLDGGSSWSPVALPAHAGAIGYADASSWWWIGSGASARSSDGGRTWTPPRPAGVLVPLPAMLQLVDAKTAWFGAMAGARPVMETTNDGGLHWRMVRLPPIAP